jgi:endo-1,4-beta-xylanase
MRKLAFALMLGALGVSRVFAADRGMEIPLWQGVEPAADVFETAEGSPLPKRFTVVNRPAIYVFLPPEGKANGTAVVIAPGGGHSQLVIDKEGWEMADWFNKIGVAAFVLKYRLARAPKSPYSVQGDALNDAARAVRVVRARAKEFGVDPQRIGFMGFSAGGELAALIETRFDAGNSASSDPTYQASSRPDFALLIYPGWRPDTVITVPKDAPQTFLVCADDDPSHVVITVNQYLALEKQGISAEMHIYSSGKHGFGLRAPASQEVSQWPERMKDWMVERKLLPQ